MTSKKKEAFSDVLLTFNHRYDLRSVFDDLLTITICAFSQNIATGKSYDEDLYMATIARYKPDEVRDIFPKLLALLMLEMEERIDSGFGSDVLGDFYEQNLYSERSSQYFTPWPVCKMMASITMGEDTGETEEPLRILDPSCGSGRMLLAGARTKGTRHEYYGIDVDHTCVKMAAINLFLNGIFHGEVMCADALIPDDFRVSYAISFLPFGIFRIAEKERSKLWHRYKNSFPLKEEKQKVNVDDLVLPSQENDSGAVAKVSQLKMF